MVTIIKDTHPLFSVLATKTALASEIRARRSSRFPTSLDRSRGSRTFPSSKLKKTPCQLCHWSRRVERLSRRRETPRKSDLRVRS
ncbi:hypothetical protein SeMB42_g06970 [Synchytrium endobioticum]|uniref:Uncharacterized protein n=1 Tax=Synchytrium endobioticum TaxID=286115 RepID=A0A507CME8_9FUNG|nr:hypothetical protein SeMB42_g06970 [Synchytrium endobioticum]TPX39845.1 hypothetical protein SeLEV6574_g06956 [Synchytrium endobioticum]